MLDLMLDIFQIQEICENADFDKTIPWSLSADPCLFIDSKVEDDARVDTTGTSWWSKKS